MGERREEGPTPRYSQPSNFLKTLKQFSVSHCSFIHFSFHTHTHTHTHFSLQSALRSTDKMKAAILRSVLLRSISSSASLRTSSYVSSRGFSSESAPERKVTILGAAGGIGQPLSLLMKLNPLVSNLALYDIAGTPGVAADVSHINTRSEVLCSSSIKIFS